MANHLRFFPDYFAEFPLWTDDGRDPADLAEQLPLSSHLVELLQAWAREFNEWPHGELRPLADDVRAWQIDFSARGESLAEEVRRELGPEYAVEYRSPLTN